MEVAGFSGIAGGYPTILSKDTSYKAATFADHLFVAMLYHPELPKEPDEAALLEHWTSNIAAV